MDKEIANLTMVTKIMEEMGCECKCIGKVKGLLQYLIDSKKYDIESARPVKKARTESFTDK